MKLFVDDERMPPGVTECFNTSDWEIARSADDAIERLTPPVAVPVTLLSLDHDLGEPSATNNGAAVAAWLEAAVIVNGMVPPKILQVHSGNPVGVANILSAFQSIARFCALNGMEVPEIRRIQPPLTKM